jgi:hypothetical protein
MVHELLDLRSHFLKSLLSNTYGVIVAQSHERRLRMSGSPSTIAHLILPCTESYMHHFAAPTHTTWTFLCRKETFLTQRFATLELMPVGKVGKEAV